MSLTADARALVARSRAAQGLPEQITNPALLEHVANIFQGRRRDSWSPSPSLKEAEVLASVEAAAARTRQRRERKAAEVSAANAQERSELRARWARDHSPEQIQAIEIVLDGLDVRE